MTLTLYCYDGITGTDPHALQIELSQEDVQFISRIREVEEPKLRPTHFGTFCNVTDQATGRRYKVATAPCGLGCHCASVAVRIEEE